LIPAQRHDGNPGESVIHARVTVPAAKNLGEGGRRRHDLGAAPICVLDAGAGRRMPGGELNQALSIEDQGAA
jgi:hypothetical protein